MNHFKEQSEWGTSAHSNFQWELIDSVCFSHADNYLDIVHGNVALSSV